MARGLSLGRVLVVASLATWSAAAHAQGAKGGAASTALSPQDEANARFQTGLKYYDARDFESARLAFLQAYAVLKRPGILLNLALSELYAGRPLDALGHLDTFLAETDLTPDKRVRATKARDEAFAKTGHLRIKAAKGADVTLDGDALAAVPELVHVAPGEHTVTASAAGVTQTRKVVATAGVETPVDVMGPAETPSSSGPMRTYETVSTFWGPRTLLGLVALGVGAAAGVFAVVENGAKDDALDRTRELNAALPPGACRTNPPAVCTDLARAADDADDAKATRNVAIGVGAGLGAVGVGLLVSAVVWPHKRLKESYVVVGPGPAALGTSLGMRF